MKGLCAICSGLWLLVAAFLLSSCGGGEEGGGACDTLLSTMQNEYATARKLQRDGRYETAIVGFKRCLVMPVGEVAATDSLLPVVADAMTQLLNSYQCIDRPDDCVAYFDSLRRHPSPFIEKYARRDLLSTMGYALSRTDRMGEAEMLTDSALAMPLHEATAERLFRDYAYAAAVFFPNPKREEQVVGLCRQALSEARRCHNTSGAQYVTSMLGTMYRRMGRLSEAIDLYTESLETARQKGDALGQTVACNALAELYLYLKLPKYADTYASMALTLREDDGASNAMIRTPSLLLKGEAQEAIGHVDSARLFYDKAYNECCNLPYTSGMADVDYLRGRYAVRRCSGDSLARGMARLERVAMVGTTFLRAKANYVLAQGFKKQHRKAEAEARLDSMYALLHSFTPTQYLDIDYKAIIDYYAAKGDLAHTRQYAADLANVYAAETSTDARSRVYETIVDMKTEAMAKQLSMDKMRLDNERIYWQIGLAASVLAIIALGMFMGYHRKLTNAKRLLMQRQISELLSKLEVAKSRQENAEKQLAEAIVQSKRQAVAHDLDIPLLLKDNGIDEFRLRFEKLYPTFVATIRQRAANLTRMEETHCMLIALGQDLHQVAVLMGIAYRSVNMARYRIRKKFGLTKEETLESAIRTIFDGAAY